MTRRSLTVAVVTLTSFALAACAESPTAPQRTQLKPAGASSQTLQCRAGYLSSEGRC